MGGGLGCMVARRRDCQTGQVVPLQKRKRFLAGLPNCFQNPSWPCDCLHEAGVSVFLQAHPELPPPPLKYIQEAIGKNDADTHRRLKTKLGNTGPKVDQMTCC
eukprot:jgi/Mesvir1/1761/Mv25456-RA.1